MAWCYPQNGWDSHELKLLAPENPDAKGRGAELPTIQTKKTTQRVLGSFHSMCLFYALERMVWNGDPLFAGRLLSVGAGAGSTWLIYRIGAALDDDKRLTGRDP